MSPVKKKFKRKAKPNVTKDNIVDKEAEKKKLAEEVRVLKKELKALRDDEKNLNDLVAIEKQNVNEPLQPNMTEHKMFEFYGIVCETEDDESSKFIFPMLNKDGSRTEYFIHISNNDEQRELMKFFLPSSINLDEILAETPINNAKKFPDLLLQLRHNILCYQSRKSQLEELKEHLVALQNCEVVYRNNGITKILIRFYLIEHETTKKTFNLDISVMYLSNERLPHQFSVTPSSVTDDDFDDQTLKLLKKKFVKSFKNMELKHAIENLVQTDTRPFIWTSTTRPLDENVDPSLSEDEDSIEEFFTSLKNKTIAKDTKKEKKTKKKSEKKSKAGTANDENVKIKKSKKEMKKKRTETLDSQNEDEQQTELTMDSPAKRNETSNKSLNLTVVDGEAQENQSEDEHPAETTVKIPVKKKKNVNQSLKETATDEKETMKKSGKIKKGKQVEMVESQSTNEQLAEPTEKSSVKKKKTTNQSVNKTATDEIEPVKKSEKRKKANPAEVVESQSINEKPAETTVKSPVKKKKTANQSINITATDEIETKKKSEKRKKTKKAEVVEIQSINEQPAETTVKSPIKKTKTANQSLNETTDEKETTKKDKKKKAKQAEVVESQSTNEQPAETPVKSSAKKKRTANQSLNKSLTKKMKIDPKQTTLTFENKVDDAKKTSEIPVIKKKLPTIVKVQKFSSSTPLVSKHTLRSGKEHFCDISNISEIGKE